MITIRQNLLCVFCKAAERDRKVEICQRSFKILTEKVVNCWLCLCVSVCASVYCVVIKKRISDHTDEHGRTNRA